MGALSVSQFVDLMVGGLAVGCVYSLIALGFAMIMRATNIIHFAQGEVMMLGCMCGLTSVWLLPVLPLLAVVAVGMASSGIIAVAMELAVYRTLRRRRVPIMNLITATVGMSILCINAARIVWGSEPLRFPELFATTAYEFGGVRVSPQLFWIMVMAVVMMAYPFAISGMMAGAAGIMLGSMFFAFFEMGFITGLKGFVAATLGGLGSITGAMLGGVLFGLIETFSTVFLSSAYKDGIGMILLIAILLVFPSGLVGLWQRRR